MALSLDRRAPEPLHVQLGRQLRQMILSRRMGPGARLPSSRALALDLGVSRATVVLALDQLASEGYVEGRQGAGHFVSVSLPEQALQVALAPPHRERARPPPPARTVRPFHVGAGDQTLFPHQAWARLIYRRWRAPGPELLGGADPLGWHELRHAIAGHLREWRGIACAAEQIVITSGTADATDMIAHAAFRRGDAVCVEDPGYPTVRYGLASAGLLIRPVSVDADGFDPGRAGPGPVRGAIVTPSRQFPLGRTLPLARRLELLEWADRVDGYVVEDDFDSEYRYEGSPLPALMSLDGHGRAIYIGSFSKVLSPTLRLGFVVFPDRLLRAVRDHLGRRGAMASLLAQPALAEFVGGGDYATHIRRTRRVYARRLAALVAEQHRLAGLLDIEPATAGMHVVADLAKPLSARMTDREVAQKAHAAGITVAPLADFYAGRPQRSAVLMGFAAFPEDEIRRAVRRLAAALE